MIWGNGDLLQRCSSCFDLFLNTCCGLVLVSSGPVTSVSGLASRNAGQLSLPKYTLMTLETLRWLFYERDSRRRSKLYKVSREKHVSGWLCHGLRLSDCTATCSAVLRSDTLQAKWAIWYHACILYSILCSSRQKHCFQQSITQEKETAQHMKKMNRTMSVIGMNWLHKLAQWISWSPLQTDTVSRKRLVNVEHFVEEEHFVKVEHITAIVPHGVFDQNLSRSDCRALCDRLHQIIVCVVSRAVTGI